MSLNYEPASEPLHIYVSFRGAQAMYKQTWFDWGRGGVGRVLLQERAPVIPCTVCLILA